MVTLTPEDFKPVAQLAAHCDLTKLNIATREAIRYEMETLFCDFWLEVETNWASTDPTWRSLIDGDNYTGCNDRNRRHAGLKDALVHFAYSRYLILNGFNDTPTGNVTKNVDFSIPKPLKEIQSFADKYRNMGIITVERIKNYLCLQDSEVFTTYEKKDCHACGCNGECGSDKINTTGYGVKSKNISKWDV